MKFTHYKVMMLDELGDQKFHTISSSHYTKTEANEWIKMYDPNNRKTFKIKSDQLDTKDFDQKSQVDIKNKQSEI